MMRSLRLDLLLSLQTIELSRKERVSRMLSLPSALRPDYRISIFLRYLPTHMITTISLKRSLEFFRFFGSRRMPHEAISHLQGQDEDWRILDAMLARFENLRRVLFELEVGCEAEVLMSGDWEFKNEDELASVDTVRITEQDMRAYLGEKLPELFSRGRTSVNVLILWLEE